MTEMEANDDVAVKNLPDGEDPVSAPINNLHDEAVDETESHDFSTLSKAELVEIVKDLARQRDYKKSEGVLKEIKARFTEMQESEKSEALKRFVDSGGSPDDFEYRPDLLDTSFEAHFRVLRDLRTEFFRNLEEEKNENLKKKNALLEELRALVDGEDNKQSFDRFKEIQQSWKSAGAVPAAQVRPLWASYQALVDRFYDNRNIYFELKELDRKKNLEAKTELCIRAEKLADIAKIGDAVRELSELHEEYKHIGPVSKEDKDAVWERFKKATDAVYKRRDAFVTQLHAELNKNLELKEQVVAEVQPYASFQTDRIKEWNQKTAEIIALQKKWEGIGVVPRAKSKDLNKKFWSAFKSFFANKGVFFKKLDDVRVQNLELKKDLVKQAEEIKVSQDWDKTANELKNLQAKWKEIGPVPEKYREKIYQEFKAACDFFFDQRRVKLEAADKEQIDNLAKKEAICAELEKLGQDKTGTLGQLKDLQRSFHSVGFVPRQSITSIKSRFSTAMDKFIESLDQVSREEKDKVLLEIELDNLKTDPDAGHKLHLREQALRKRIGKAENDLATLKNNLEFFARSKNADKLREEFNAKIAASAEELVQLKNQLKILKAAV